MCYPISLKYKICIEQADVLATYQHGVIDISESLIGLLII